MVEEAGNLLIVDLVSNTYNFVISNLFFNINPNPKLIMNSLRPKKIVAFEGYAIYNLLNFFKLLK